MERKIGEEFDYNGQKLKVLETVMGTCAGCVFKDNCNRNIKAVTGVCNANVRADKRQVVFVAVAQASNEEPQKQKLNLCEVLRDCPEGTPFWSPMLGDVKFWCVSEPLVTVEDKAGNSWDINSDSTLTIGGIGGVTSEEPMLYPSKEQRDWSKVLYPKPIELLPKTWIEFCNGLLIKNEYFIDEDSEISLIEGITHRMFDDDKNVLPTRRAAEQHLALMQLHQLRDCWRDGWKPEPNETRWCITKDTHGDIDIDRFNDVSVFLSFQDKERAEKFLECFRDLIEQAGDLI